MLVEVIVGSKNRNRPPFVVAQYLQMLQHCS